MKKLSLVLVAVLASLGTAAQAATETANFTVSVALTSKCRVVPATDNQTLGFTYTAFAAADVAANSNITINFECTRGLTAPTVIFDTDGTTKTTGTAAAASVTGNGVVGGLRYEITATKGSVTNGNAATPAAIGTPDTIPYTISGKIFAGQAGTGPNGTYTQARTLTLEY